MKFFLYEGRSKSFEPNYLLIDFWAKKVYISCIDSGRLALPLLQQQILKHSQWQL